MGVATLCDKASFRRPAWSHLFNNCLLVVRCDNACDSYDALMIKTLSACNLTKLRIISFGTYVAKSEVE